MLPLTTRKPRVCAYDGQCYRKNPQHFIDYAHPKQYPTQQSQQQPQQHNTDFPNTVPAVTATATTADCQPPLKRNCAEGEQIERNQRNDTQTAQALPAETLLAQPAPRRTETIALECATASTSQESTTTEYNETEEEKAGHSAASHSAARGQPSPPTEKAIAGSNNKARMQLEEGAPSLELLRYLLDHDPTPECVGLDEMNEKGIQGDHVPDLSAHAMRHIEPFLQSVYGMPFPSGDLRAVLLAATRLKPADPMNAFHGWRLVGPAELVWREQQQQQQQHVGQHNRHVRFASEATQWRVARYPHDPPECQTITVERASAAGGSGHHLCYHRDDPSDIPVMLVRGTAKEYELEPSAPGLAAYLLASAGDAGRDAEAKALCDAIKEVREDFAAAIATTTATPPTGAHDRRKAREGHDCKFSLPEDSELRLNALPTLAALKKTATARRKRDQVASTPHGIGISVPYDKKSEMGYRPLMIRKANLQGILKAWDADYALKMKHQTAAVLPAHGKGSVAHFTTADWNELQEQFRYADMANDEGDFGLNLELGMYFFSLVSTLSSKTTDTSSISSSAAPHPHGEDGSGPEHEGGRLNPLLWHAFRILDCVYMLLNRPMYRHILRCHLPVLAGQREVLLDSTQIFISQ